MDFTVYRLNMRIFEEAYEALKETVLKPDIVTDRRVEGTVSVKAPGRLVISIPAGISTDIPPYRRVIFTFDVVWTAGAAPTTSISSGIWLGSTLTIWFVRATGNCSGIANCLLTSV